MTDEGNSVDAAGDNPATPLPGPSKISIVTPAIVDGNDDKRQPVGESKGHLFEALEQRIKDKDELIVILRSELDIKNKQIEKRDTQFDKHLELSTQTNVLLQGFQKLFSEGLFKLLPTSVQEGKPISENGGVEVQHS